MKCVLLLLLALPCICLASKTVCNPTCTLILRPVCVATLGKHVYFANECTMKYYKCITGQPMHVVSNELCEGHSLDEGQKLMVDFLDKKNLSGSDSDESDSDKNSSSSD